MNSPFSTPSLSFTRPLLVVAGIAIISHTLSAATIPYFEDFESATAGDTPPAGFVESPDSAWSVSNTSPISGANSYVGIAEGVANTFVGISSIVDFSGSLGGPASTANNFVMSSLLRTNAGTTGGSGSVSFGLTALMSEDGQDGYNLRTTTSGIVQVVEVTGGSATVRVSIDQGSISQGTNYTFTLSGTYSDSNADLTNDRLTLELTIEGTGMSGAAVTWVDTTPHIGTYFGYRHFTTSSATVRSANISHDNLSVVPEPATLPLILVGVSLFLASRRSRSVPNLRTS